MNESERLAGQLDRAMNGGAWHGPSVHEALEGVTRTAALARPVATAHTIAEIVGHAATWHDIVRRRLEGESPQVPDEVDWPPSALADDAAWEASKRRLAETARELSGTVRRFPPEQWHEPRPRVGDTWFDLVAGELQHMTYHAGQIALLRKAAAPKGI